MVFPSEKELKKIREKLKNVLPSNILPENPSKVEKLKHSLCQKFVVYIQENEISQSELAKQLNMDTARLNEIVKYKINLFTIDKLIYFTQKLDPDLEIMVA